MTWEEKRAEQEDSQSECGNSEPVPPGSPPAVVKEGQKSMEEERGINEEERGEHVSLREQERDGLPTEIEVLEATPKEDTPTEPFCIEAMPLEATPCIDTPPPQAPPTHDDSIRSYQSEVGERQEAVTPIEEVGNGENAPTNKANVTLSLSKQAPAIINRTARPFGSPAIMQASEDFPPPPSCVAPPTSCVTPPVPHMYSPPPPTFSPPPPINYSSQPPSAYSNPIPPTYSSPAPQVYSSPSPVAYSNPTPAAYSSPVPHSYSSPPPLSRVISPTPCMPQYTPPTSAPRPSFIPEILGDRRPAAPIKTGLLEEGKARRAARKSMFTFQEKPKIAPNPELLSLVQGVDERKKAPPLSEHGQEEELLALGAEASNFLPRDDAVSGVEEALVPEWSSCLKSSGPRARREPRPEQGLSNASGKGAELFARRQSRMERFTTETPPTAGGDRAMNRPPSPTMSLPPSWTFPSNMPGRVKAMAGAANVQTPPPSRTSRPKPRPVPTATATATPIVAQAESTVLENGCTKLEMDISRHQPYQLNSSLFILNPTRDPMSSLPKAAPPPPRPVGVDRASYGRQASLPLSSHLTPPPLSPHFTSPTPFRPFSPQVPPSPLNGASFGDLRSNCGAPAWPQAPQGGSPVSALTPERVASPRSAVQVPRPTFSAKRAGIEPQARRESLPTPTMCTSMSTPVTSATPVTPPMATPSIPQQPRRFSSTEGPAGSLKLRPASPAHITASSTSHSTHPSAFSSPLSPPQGGGRCQSPLASSGLENKANRRLLAQNIINAAKRKNSPSPGTGVARGASPATLSPFQPHPLGSHSPTLTSPPLTPPTHSTRSPVRLYATRSLTDSDASLESEDSGLRSPGLRSYNTCPRGWGGSLRVKRGSIPADL
ncbi:hypothetical protein AGOR_G00068480 [Albula goreensis]|uniref:Synaptopodin n=1 Tax=Albula goreensis TaxID=1534307 RepID=A0A8T3DLF6_9TELE|nr:hypothetical protein AGOR_G00068480 [Albula goreensis]